MRHITRSHRTGTKIRLSVIPPGSLEGAAGGPVGAGLVSKAAGQGHRQHAALPAPTTLAPQQIDRPAPAPALRKPAPAQTQGSSTNGSLSAAAAQRATAATGWAGGASARGGFSSTGNRFQALTEVDDLLDCEGKGGSRAPTSRPTRQPVQSGSAPTTNAAADPKNTPGVEKAPQNKESESSGSAGVSPVTEGGEGGGQGGGGGRGRGRGGGGGG